MRGRTLFVFYSLLGCSDRIGNCYVEDGQNATARRGGVANPALKRWTDAGKNKVEVPMELARNASPTFCNGGRTFLELFVGGNKPANV